MLFIIHQILTLKTLLIFLKSVLQNHILFWLLVLFLPHIVLYVKDQGEKQKKVIEINKTELDNKQQGDELLLSKERQIFKNF